MILLTLAGEKEKKLSVCSCPPVPLRSGRHLPPWTELL